MRRADTVDAARRRPTFAILALVASITSGCSSSHDPSFDAGHDAEGRVDSGPRRCELASRDACCAVRGCHWYESHGGCFDLAERCMTDADCVADRRCEIMRLSQNCDDCAGSCETAFVDRGLCVPRDAP